MFRLSKTHDCVTVQHCGATRRMMEQHRGNLDERCNVTSNSHIVMIKRVRLKPTQDDQVLPIGRSLHSFGRTAQSKHVFYGKTCNALTWKDVTASRKVTKEKKKKKKKNKSSKDRTWSAVPDALLEVIN